MSKNKKALALPLTLLAVTISIALIFFISSLTYKLSEVNEKTKEVNINTPHLENINNHLVIFLKSNTCAKKTHLSNSEILSRFINHLSKSQNIDDMDEEEINEKEFYKKPFEIEYHGIKESIEIQDCVNQYLSLLSKDNYYGKPRIWVKYKNKKIFLTDERFTFNSKAELESVKIPLKDTYFTIYMYFE